MPDFSIRSPASRQRIAAALAFVAALLAATAAQAGSVTDCGDAQDATSTLRGVVASASDHDLVDVSQCATIVLQQGVITTAFNLTIQGPLDGLTTIDAATNGRAFVDTGAESALTLSHLLLEHGRAPGDDPNGGCVLAAKQINVEHSTLSDCAATSNLQVAHGGAVNAPTVSLISSVITSSLASSATADAQGGAVYASAQITCTNSVLEDNSVLSGGDTTGPFGRGGGLYTNQLSLTRCAVVGNHARHSGGGIFGFGVFILDSTVSGNTSDYGVGGIAASSFATISNSTIAFNHGDTCGGLYSSTAGGSLINSTILANNTATTATGCHDVAGGFGAGTNNIVGVADAGVTLPGDTYIGDPQLTPLGNHGGPTPTHALAPASYAIDHGNDMIGLGTDQRGYDRAVNGVADIGAYERQLVDDEIFYGGFE